MGLLNIKSGTHMATEWDLRLAVLLPAQHTTLLDFLWAKASRRGRDQGCRQTSLPLGTPKWESMAHRGRYRPAPTPSEECINHFQEEGYILLHGPSGDRSGRRDRTGVDPAADRCGPGRWGPRVASPLPLGRRRRRRRPRESCRGWAASPRLFPFPLRLPCLPGRAAISPEAPLAAYRPTPTQRPQRRQSLRT